MTPIEIRQKLGITKNEFDHYRRRNGSKKSYDPADVAAFVHRFKPDLVRQPDSILKAELAKRFKISHQTADIWVSLPGFPPAAGKFNSGNGKHMDYYRLSDVLLWHEGFVEAVYNRPCKVCGKPMRNNRPDTAEHSHCKTNIVIITAARKKTRDLMDEKETLWPVPTGPILTKVEKNAIRTNCIFPGLQNVRQASR